MEDFENKIMDLPLSKARQVLMPMYENGMITYDRYKQILDDMTRKKILSTHPFKISEHKDGRWRTYVITADGKRRQLVRTTRQKLEDDIVANYKSIHQENEKSPSFEDCYTRWRELQDLKVSSNTVSKYKTDFARYFDKEPFSDRPIRVITEDEVERFIFKKVQELALCKSATKHLLCYLKGTFSWAFRNKIISNDVTRDISPSFFFRQCTETDRKDDVLLVPDEDWILLCNRLLQDIKKNPLYMPPYAILMDAYTGVRVGELAVLKWSDIKQDPVSGVSYIMIQRSEIYIPGEKRYEIKDGTKTNKPRPYPITPVIQDLLDKIQKLYQEHAIETEWIFSDKSGNNIHKRNICDCLKNKCRQVGITPRGMHAFRRQINSDMRCDGVSPVITSSLIGNTKEVNDKHYTFDVSGLEEKRKIVDLTNRKRKAIAG